MGNEKTKVSCNIQRGMFGCTERVAFSGAYEAGIEAAGKRRISCPLDDCAAIGEDGKSVFAAAEAQKKLIGTDFSVGLEALFERSQVDGPVMFMNLHGVASAEGDMRAAFAA